MNLPPLVSKILYAILLSPLHSKQSNIPVLSSTMYQTKSRYKRTISVVRLVDKMLPGATDKLSRWIYKNNHFPWKPVDSELIAFGTGAAVFKVNWTNGTKVLRIYRRSLGKSLSGLLEIAGHYKRNYETVLSWYGNSHGLVLPMVFLVYSGLPFAIPITGSLQPYVGGQKKDLFEDFSDEELLGLFEANGHLREQFIFFARQTLHQWNGRKLCLDCLGNENLMLINDDGDYRLCIVDVGLFELEAIAKKHPEKMSRIEQRMDRLASLYKQARKFSQTQGEFTTLQELK